jgi:transposase InsO family protein
MGSIMGVILSMGRSHDLLRGSLRENDIVAQYSTPSEPQQNGVAKRRNRMLMDMVRSMLSYSKLPLVLWMYALKMLSTYSL